MAVLHVRGEIATGESRISRLINRAKLFHMGLKIVPARSTLSDALNLRGAIPAFIHISDGKMHDVNVLDLLPIEAGAFYVMDHGYLDFARLYKIHQAGAFFVIGSLRVLVPSRKYRLGLGRCRAGVSPHRAAREMGLAVTTTSMGRTPKASGFGREKGLERLSAYLRAKSIPACI